MFALEDDTRVSMADPVGWEMEIVRLWPGPGGSPEVVLLRDSFRFKAKFTICKESLSNPDCDLSASFAPLGSLDELVEACTFEVDVGACWVVVESGVLAGGSGSSAEFLCRLHGKRDRFL